MRSVILLCSVLCCTHSQFFSGTNSHPTLPSYQLTANQPTQLGCVGRVNAYQIWHSPACEPSVRGEADRKVC